MKNTKSNGVRAQQKEKTRQSLINAAFNQLNAEQGFVSLSLREVSREAGIAATSFYRHFKDMDELGLAMVDESGLTLRQLMRQARKRIERGGSVLQTSVTTFIEFIDKNPKVFLLLLREKAGTSPDFRSAIAREIQHFIVELVDYLDSANKMPRHYNQAQAEAMVTIAFNAGAEAIDLDSVKRQKLIGGLIFQLRMVSRGAYYLHYREQLKKQSNSSSAR